MKKLFFFLLVSCCTFLWAESSTISLKITNITVDNGDIYIALFNGKDAYKHKNACISKKISPQTNDVELTFEEPYGEYVFSIFQDTNRNGKLDTKLFGIPKEKFGLSNYSGKGIPSGFDGLKIVIDKPQTEVIIPLVTM